MHGPPTFSAPRPALVPLQSRIGGRRRARIHSVISDELGCGTTQFATSARVIRAAEPTTVDANGQDARMAGQVTFCATRCLSMSALMRLYSS